MSPGATAQSDVSKSRTLKKSSSKSKLQNSSLLQESLGLTQMSHSHMSKFEKMVNEQQRSLDELNQKMHDLKTLRNKAREINDKA